MPKEQAWQKKKKKGEKRKKRKKRKKEKKREKREKKKTICFHFTRNYTDTIGPSEARPTMDLLLEFSKFTTLSSK